MTPDAARNRPGPYNPDMSSGEKERVLLLVPTNTYRAPDFLEAAERLDVQVVVGSPEKQAFEDVVPGSSLTVDPHEPEGAVERILQFHERFPLSGIVGADDETTVLAARAAKALELPHNPPEAVHTTRDKHRLRQALADAGLPSPWFRLVSRDEDPEETAREVEYPCVLKPTFLAASRGVLRADDPGQFVAAFERIEGILDEPEVREEGGEAADTILVEEYLPGDEYAVEGMLSGGELRVLALFDKPEPMEGPTFEETLYVTPSRAPEEVRRSLVTTTVEAINRLGLREGPVHAELRVDDADTYLIEIAARAIGGLCPRVLRFGTGHSLEELILMHATGHDFFEWERDRRPAGVLMLPTPRAGILEGVDGVEEAEALNGIEKVVISINRGQRVRPLPESNRYLGFVFARHRDPDRVEAALREAWEALEIRIRQDDTGQTEN